MKRDIDIGRDYLISVTIDTTRDGLQEQLRRVYAPAPNYVRYADATPGDAEAVRQTSEYRALRAEAETRFQTLRAQQEAERRLEAQVAAEMAALLQQARSEGTPCYLRYRRPPESGRSYNARDDIYEAGVSVYRAYRLGDRYVIDLTGHDPVSSLFISQTNGDPYLVTGENIGTGADGEPLLRHVRIIKPIPQTHVTLAWE